MKMGTWTKGYPKSVELDDEAQAELALMLMREDTDPEEHRCKTCGAIYDDGQFCTYCGDFDPLDLGED